MKIFGINIEKTKAARPAINVNVGELNQMFRTLLSMVASGMPLQKIASLSDTIDKGYLYNHIVYSIVNRIAASCAGVPWTYYVEKRTGSKARYNRAIINKAIDDAIYIKQTQFEPDYTSDINMLIDKPNRNETFDDIIQQLIMYYEITGNAYLYGIRRNGTQGALISLHTAPANLVTIKFNNYLNPVGGYIFDGFDPSGVIPPENMMHVKTFNPNFNYQGSWLYGLSPIMAAADLINLSNSAISAQINSYRNSGAKGLLTPEGNEAMTEEQAQKVVDKWREKQAPENFGDAMVVGKALKWIPIGLSPVDMQIIEGQKMNLRDLCRIYQVPSMLMGDTEATTYNNMKEARKALVTDASLPMMEKLKSGFNRFFLPEGDKGFVDYDLQAFIELQDDLDKLATTLNTMGWLTINEKRTKSFLNEIDLPILNEVLIPMGVMPASQFSNEPLNPDLGDNVDDM